MHLGREKCVIILVVIISFDRWCVGHDLIIVFLLLRPFGKAEMQLLLDLLIHLVRGLDPVPVAEPVPIPIQTTLVKTGMRAMMMRVMVRREMLLL
jgi:hypothetical protein